MGLSGPDGKSRWYYVSISFAKILLRLKLNAGVLSTWHWRLVEALNKSAWTRCTFWLSHFKPQFYYLPHKELSRKGYKQTLPEAQRTQKLTQWLGIKFSNNMAPLAFKFSCIYWAPDGATCISCKFGHQMAPLAIVINLTTRWHHLH